VETVAVVLIVLTAVAWAGREVWRAVRQARKPACGCPSASRCAVARNCTQAAAPVSPAESREHPDTGARTI
jgi:hypothetical protein